MLLFLSSIAGIASSTVSRACLLSASAAPRKASTGKADELSPFSQSVELAEALEQRGMPYELYAYDGLKHYFSTRTDNAATQQMFQASLDCMRRLPAGE